MTERDLILRDYSQQHIRIGAMATVELEVSGKGILTLIYLWSDGNSNVEPCLLGTNVIASLGLLIPAECVQAGSMGPSTQCLSAHLVKLTRTEKIPVQHGVVLCVCVAELHGLKGAFDFCPRMMRSSQEDCSC